MHCPTCGRGGEPTTGTDTPLDNCDCPPTYDPPYDPPDEPCPWCLAGPDWECIVSERRSGTSGQFRTRVVWRCRACGGDY